MAAGATGANSLIRWIGSAEVVTFAPVCNRSGQNMALEFQIGIIGYGGFGQYLHQAWAGHPGVQVAAVADAGNARRPEQPVRFYHQWRKLLADPQIDIVAVATPCSTHAEIAIAALREGKHVLVEKPLATTVESAREIIAARNTSDRVAAVDYMQRYNPLVQAVKALSDNNTLGALRRIAVENYAADDRLPPEHWFWDLKQSGGILVEHGVHFFDLADYLSGTRVVQVNGAAARRPDGRIDRMAAGCNMTADYWPTNIMPSEPPDSSSRLPSAWGMAWPASSLTAGYPWEAGLRRWRRLELLMHSNSSPISS